ncbi:MAG: hypothetical protein GY929_16130 [Actinomycetia bacterium]|nr:hypothetical protein [Actinomycetes bacterium]
MRKDREGRVRAGGRRGQRTADPTSVSQDRQRSPMGAGGKAGVGLGGLGIIGVILALLFGGGLGGGDGGSTGGGSSAPVERPGGVMRDQLSTAENRELDRFLEAAVADIGDFWRVTYPDVYGGSYRPPTEVFPFSVSRNEPQLSCGGPVNAAVMNLNAIYCPAGDYITWDDEQLIASLATNNGDLSVAVVLAHEWGHSIQDSRRANVKGATIIKELQADCFAGAWTGSVMRGETDLVEFSPSELDGALAGFLLLRDPPGTDIAAQQAHGSGFDRIGAFREGVEQGAQHCKTYETAGFPLLDFPLDEADYHGTGNLPYVEALDAAIEDLDAFWRDTIVELTNGEDQFGLVDYRSSRSGTAECPSRTRSEDGPIFYCEDTGSITWDDDSIEQVHGEFGDFSIAVLLAHEYGHGIIELAGAATNSRDTELLADCLAGAWSGRVAYGESTTGLSLSAGDLDEAMSALLRLRHPDRFGVADDINAFDRIDQFQAGFFDGANACRIP